MKLSNKEKERLAEDKFREWLNDNKIPFWYIQQDALTFSHAFKEEMTRRPDFIILLPNIGFIITDVEYKSPAKKYAEFQINVDETNRYCKLQEKYRLNIWYVFSDITNHFTVWYWIPVSKVREIGKDKNYGEYFGIPLDNFIVISKNQGIERLFSEMKKF
ncbi:MAG: hypothetical protein DRN33_02630 [Thermoplasmata archaeon]|nr:MAG: hypothetical protein FE043_00570 [Thermoplasmata archaeon]RLF64209.1 MAG: hypothetical protein DRN33_02630 [Thermoplasmata archaeon]